MAKSKQKTKYELLKQEMYPSNQNGRYVLANKRIRVSTLREYQLSLLQRRVRIDLYELINMPSFELHSTFGGHPLLERKRGVYEFVGNKKEGVRVRTII